MTTRRGKATDKEREQRVLIIDKTFIALLNCWYRTHTYPLLWYRIMNNFMLSLITLNQKLQDKFPSSSHHHHYYIIRRHSSDDRKIDLEGAFQSESHYHNFAIERNDKEVFILFAFADGNWNLISNISGAHVLMKINALYHTHAWSFENLLNFIRRELNET